MTRWIWIAFLFFLVVTVPLAPQHYATADASPEGGHLLAVRAAHVHPLCNPTVAKNVSITLTNTIASPTGAYVQELTIPSFLYGAINQTWNNVDFIYSNGVKANAWIESGASKSQITTVWINQSSIAASGSRTIYMNVLSGCGATQMNGINGPTGEAPQLSGSYGANDDGRLVFTKLYDNFSGSSIKAAIWTTAVQGGTVTVNNGVTIAASTSATAKPMLYSVSNLSQPLDVEWYGTMTSTCSNHANFGTGWQNINAADNVMGAFCVNTNSNKWCDISSGGTFTCGAVGSTTAGSNVIHRATSVSAAKDCYYENYVAKGCSTIHPTFPSRVAACAQLGSGSITAVWARARDNISDQITVAGFPSTTNMIYGFVHSINRFGVQVADSGANITAIRTVVGNRGSQYQQQTNSQGFYNLTVPTSDAYTVYSNRSASFGGDYGAVTTGTTGVMANLLQYPFVGYGNSTITLPAWNTSNGFLSSCNSQVPCPGSQSAGLVGMADPVIAWTSDTVYYVNATTRLVAYSLINGTTRNIAGWYPLFQNIMNYAGIENNIWITQDDAYIYSFGCVAKCISTSTITGEAVNVTTGRRWIWNYTGVTDSAFTSNAEVFMVGENGNESLLIAVEAGGTVLSYNIWTNTQATMTGSVAPFEANNEWWLPSINSLIDVDCNAHTTDFIIQFQLTGTAPGTTWTNASHLQWSTNKYSIGGAYLTTYNISAHSFVVTEGLQGGASYQYAEQIVKLSAGGPGAILSGFGQTWPMINAGGVYPNNTVLEPLVTGFEHRPNTISSGPSWAFVSNNFFQNDSGIVDPATSTWYDTNLSWTHNQTTAGCSGQCYQYRQGQIFPSADAGLFYNTTWGIEPISYDCRTNGSKCLVDNAATLGQIYWTWKVGSTKYPYPATAAKAQTYAPGPVASPFATPTSATCEAIGWNAPLYGTNPILNYTLFWGTSTPGLTHHTDLQNFNASGTNPGFIICGLTQGTTYFYQIEAWNMHWHDSMASLSFVAGVPQAPTNLHSTSTTTTTIALAWTNPPGTLVNDTVYYGTSCGTWTQLSTSGAATTKTITSLTTNTRYCIVVTAWNATGDSIYSNYINVTTATLPGAPTGLTVTGTTTTSVSLSWTAPGGGGILNYTVYYKSGFACTGSLSTQNVASGVTATVSGLTTGTTYTFCVSAWNVTGQGAKSSSVTATTNTVPGAPTGLSITSTTTTSIALSWSAPSGGGILNYTVYYKSGFSCSGSLSSQNVASGTTATVSGLSQNTTYSFCVSAWNATGQSAKSSTVTGTTYILVGAPTGLSVTSTTTTSISLSWTAPYGGGVLNYTLYYKAGFACTGALSTQNVASGTTATVSGLTTNTAYEFCVSAWNSTGQGPKSTAVNGVTATLPGAPTGLSVTSKTTTSISLSWTAPSGGGILNYTMYYKQGFACTGALSTQNVASGTTATVSGLSTNTAYTFCVSAWNVTGQGPKSTAVTGVTATLPGSPNSLAVTGTTTTSISLSWSAPSGGGILNYTIYYKSGFACTGALSTQNVASGTSATVSGLTTDTTYAFCVTAWNVTGQSAKSATLPATTATVPGAPTGLSTTGTTTTSVSLSWTAPSGGGILNYTVYYKSGFACTGSLSTQNVASGTTATVSGLTTDTTYAFCISAWNATGQGPKSSTLPVTTATLPGAPTALSVTGQNAYSISLSWVNPSGGGLVNATVYRGASCGSWTNTYSVGSAAQSYTVTGLNGGATTYCFAVTVWNATGQSAKSSTTTGTTLPNGVTALTVSTVTASSITLTWSNPSGTIANDTVYYATACSSVTGHSTGGSATTFTATSLSGATTYCFKVAAWSSSGQGNLTWINGTTLPGQVTGLSLSAATVTSLTILWNNPSGTLVNNSVYYGTSCSSLTSHLSIGSSAAGTVVNGLSGATTYCFKVAAWSSSGSGAPSATFNATTLPGAITGLTVTGFTTGTLTISWTNPSGTIVNDTVYYATVCSSATGHTTGGSAVTYTASGLAWATKYCFKVQAWSAQGAGVLTWVNGTTLPGAPTGLAMTAITTGVKVTLTWSNPNGTLVNDTVLAGTTCGTWTFRNSTAGAATSYTIGGLTNLTTYCFAVIAWSASGNGSASATILDRPAAPTGLMNIGTTTTTISLTWVQPASTVFRTTVSYGTSCAFGSTQTINGAYGNGTLTNLLPGTTYCVAVADWGFGGESLNSATINATTVPLVPLAPPIALHVTGQTTGSVSLAWTNPAGVVDNITVWYGLTCAPTQSTAAGPNTTKTVTGLLSSTTYCFEAQAWRSGQGSNLSSPAIATTLTPSGGSGGPPGCPFSCPAVNNTTLGIGGQRQVSIYLVLLAAVGLVVVGAALVIAWPRSRSGLEAR